MSLDASDMEKIAHLAPLAVDPESIGRYAADLSNILDLVARMDAVETSDVQPMAHRLPLTGRIRSLRRGRVERTPASQRPTRARWPGFMLPTQWHLFASITAAITLGDTGADGGCIGAGPAGSRA